VGDFLEPVFSRLVPRIEIRVQLLGELAVSLGDFTGLRGLGHAKFGIEILCHRPILTAGVNVAGQGVDCHARLELKLVVTGFPRSRE
jgi:hypothetical protein